MNHTLMPSYSVLRMICFRSCPTSGAHSCDIQYAMDNESGLVYPAFINIDFEEMRSHEDAIFLIEAVRAVDCASSSAIESWLCRGRYHVSSSLNC